jgi:hypothetical protein
MLSADGSWRTVHFGSLRECHIAGLRQGEKCNIRVQASTAHAVFSKEMTFDALPCLSDIRHKHILSTAKAQREIV